MKNLNANKKCAMDTVLKSVNTLNSWSSLYMTMWLGELETCDRLTLNPIAETIMKQGSKIEKELVSLLHTFLTFNDEESLSKAAFREDDLKLCIRLARQFTIDTDYQDNDSHARYQIATDEEGDFYISNINKQ